MPAFGRLSEHEEDGAAAGQEGRSFIGPICEQRRIGEQNREGLPPAPPVRPKFPNSAHSGLIPQKYPISQQKNKTPEKPGVRQQSEKALVTQGFLLNGTGKVRITGSTDRH